jgi:hypothetical protein
MSHRERQKSVGIALISAAVLLPCATYGGALAWLRYLASVDPIPNQGAMGVAYLAVCASGIVAVVLGLIGIGLLILGSARS